MAETGRNLPTAWQGGSLASPGQFGSLDRGDGSSIRGNSNISIFIKYLDWFITAF